MRYFAVSLIALASVGWWNQHRTNGHERMLGRIASEIARRPVAIHCQGFPSAFIDISNRAGEVMFNADGTPPDEATLKRDTCRYLDRFEAHAALRRSRVCGALSHVSRRPGRSPRPFACSHTRRGISAESRTKPRPSATRCRPRLSWRDD